MKQSPLTRAARATLSLILVLAWLHAANHCLVAGPLAGAPAATASAESEPSCPLHQAPEQGQKDDGCDSTSCCKSLATPIALLKAALNYDSFCFVPSAFPSAHDFDLGQQHVAIIAEVDTGPPGATSFAESVLQRSILAHAPPFVV